MPSSSDDHPNVTNSSLIPEMLDNLLDSGHGVVQKNAEETIPAGLTDVLDNPQSVTDVPVAIPDIQKAIVAFVDMLGTSTLMEEVKKENAEMTYATINGIAELFQGKFHDFCKKHNDSISMMISDSFVISVRYDIDTFRDLVSFLAEFQYECLKSYTEVMRGAVSVGNMLVGTKDRIIGPAFIKAHKIEVRNAIFPRIVIDNEIVEDDNLYQQTSSLLITRDKDGIRYVDFMATTEADIEKMEKQLSTKRSTLKEKGKGLEILQKWDWLLTFLEQKKNGCLDCCKPKPVTTASSSYAL